MATDLTMYRVIGHVTRVLANSDTFNLMVPSWNPRSHVEINKNQLPVEIRAVLEKGTYLMFKCNLGAKRRSELRFDHWELAPKPWDEPHSEITRSVPSH